MAATIAPASVTVVLAREKETKRTVRYAEVGDAGHVGMIYLPKGTLEELSPGRDLDRIELTITPA